MFGGQHKRIGEVKKPASLLAVSRFLHLQVTIQIMQLSSITTTVAQSDEILVRKSDYELKRNKSK